MWVHDMRDEPLLPSTGHFVRVIQEYAGLGGDVNHIRQEVEAQVARSNNTGYVRNISLFTGHGVSVQCISGK
jgi:outer membrane protein insertion porin family